MNHIIDLLFICLNEYLNKSQLKTNLNIYEFFLYDTDSRVQAFLCAPDEHLVQSPSGYPVIGNCEKCQGLKILFNLIVSKDRNSDHNLTFCPFCHTVRKNSQ